MIWIIAIIIVVVLIGIEIYNDPWWYENILLYGLFIMVIALFIFLFVALLSTGITEYKEPEVVEQISIVAMKDNSAVEGHIAGGVFFTNGYINEKPVYTILISTDKGLTTKNYKAEETYIRYIEDGTSPRVEQLEFRGNSKAFRFWCSFDPIKYEYVIWVPKTAEITNDFVVDLE